MKLTLSPVHAATILISVLILGSCGAPEPEDIVGVWVAEDDAPSVIENMFDQTPIELVKRPFFVFSADSTFLVKHIPEMLIGSFKSTRIISASGTWSVGRKQGMSVVFLLVTEINGDHARHRTLMEVTTLSRPKKLYRWIHGEGGPAFVFERVTDVPETR